MPKFYGFGTCSVCRLPCTSGNFLIHKSKRYCTACWMEEKNPEHPDLDSVREKVASAVEEWKCAKWTREQGPLPLGPKPVKK